MKLVSWNVNGIRAVLRKGFVQFLEAEQPDVLCLQETRAFPEEVETLWAFGYEQHWNPAEKPGYSGTAIFTREPTLSVTRGLGSKEHDGEGRAITAEFVQFFLVNVYVPNSQRELTRLPYRQRWDRRFVRYLKELQARKPVVFCGDFNVAHKEVDLARPKQNTSTHGFTPQERRGFDAFVRAGFLDTFREFEPGPGYYTWWSQMNGARERNVGWRIDYFLVSRALRPALRSAFIRQAITDSDHCPVGIELIFPIPAGIGAA